MKRKDFEGYSVSENGKIVGKRGKELKSYGNNRVDLYDKDGKKHQTTNEKAKAVLSGKYDNIDNQGAYYTEGGQVVKKSEKLNPKRGLKGLFGKW